MASDQTHICNLPWPISARRQSCLWTTDAEASLCKRFYEQTRDEVIQSHPWNFAIKRETLSLLPMLRRSAGRINTNFHRLPAHPAMNGYEIYQSDGALKSRWPDDDGLRDGASPIYRSGDKRGAYPPLFVEALALKLATRLAKPITGSASESSGCLPSMSALQNLCGAQGCR